VALISVAVNGTGRWLSPRSYTSIVELTQLSWHESTVDRFFLKRADRPYLIVGRGLGFIWAECREIFQEQVSEKVSKFLRIKYRSLKGRYLVIDWRRRIGGRKEKWKAPSGALGTQPEQKYSFASSTLHLAFEYQDFNGTFI
jgi:hypothetical protein